MEFITKKQLLTLNQEEQRTLQAFGRTSFSRKSNLAIESQLTPSQIDIAVNHLVKKGLAEIKTDKSSKYDERVYLTRRGNQVRREIGKTKVEFPTPIESNIDKKLKDKILKLRSEA